MSCVGWAKIARAAREIVPTMTDTAKMAGTAQLRLCPPCKSPLLRLHQRATGLVKRAKGVVAGDFCELLVEVPLAEICAWAALDNARAKAATHVAVLNFIDGLPEFLLLLLQLGRAVVVRAMMGAGKAEGWAGDVLGVVPASELASAGRDP